MRVPHPSQAIASITATEPMKRDINKSTREPETEFAPSAIGVAVTSHARIELTYMVFGILLGFEVILQIKLNPLDAGVDMVQIGDAFGTRTHLRERAPILAR